VQAGQRVTVLARMDDSGPPLPRSPGKGVVRSLDPLLLVVRSERVRLDGARRIHATTGAGLALR